MSDVKIKSGEQPRYMTFGTSGATSTTTTAASNGMYKESPWSSFQAIVTGTGTVSATVLIQGSNEDATFQGTNANWITLVTLSPTGTTNGNDGNTVIGTWRYVRSSVTAISGTGAAVQVIMGV
jgi:hypothetical protein